MVDQSATPVGEPVAAPAAPEPPPTTNDPAPPAATPTGAHGANEGYHTGVWSGITQYIEDATGYTTFDEETMRRRLNLPPK